MKKQVQIIQKYGKTFYWASFFLEKSIKLRLFSIYAFCRRIDDLVDGNKKNQSIVSVQSFLSENVKQYSEDKFLYIQLQLEKELILYAPHKGATVWGQAEYAQNILDNMIANGVETH